MRFWTYFSIFILCLFANQANAQRSQILNSKFFGLEEGILDRRVIDLTSDTSGNFYILTPIGIQQMKGEDIVSSVSFANYNGDTKLISTNSYFLRPDHQNCVTVVRKEPLEKIKDYCLGEYIEGNIIICQVIENGIEILASDSDSYKIYLLSEIDNSICIDLLISFKHKEFVVVAKRITENEVVFIDSLGNVFSNLHELPLFLSVAEKKHEREYEPQLIKHRENLYFSLNRKEGVYRYDGTSIDTMYKSGFITSWSNINNDVLILGLSNTLFLHTDTIVVIDKEDKVHTWNEILDINNKIISFYSSDFTDHIFLMTYNGFYYLELAPSGLKFHLYQNNKTKGRFGYVFRSFTKGHNNNIIALTESSSSTFELWNNKAVKNILLSDVLGYGTNWIEYLPDKEEYFVGQYQRNGKSLISIFNIKSGKKHSVSLPLTIERFHLDGNFVWAIGRDGKNGRIVKMNLDVGSYSSEFERFLKSNDVRASYMTEQKLLFGTKGGLLAYDKNSEKIDTTLFYSTRNLYISNIRKYDDSYYVGTYGSGIYKFDSVFQIVKIIEVGKSKAANTVASMEKDSSGIIWVSTFDGIGIVNRDKLIGRIDRGNTNRTIEYNRDASFNDSNKIYFGHTNGFVSIDPSILLETVKLPELHIDEYQLQKRNERTVINPKDKNIYSHGKPSELEISFSTNKFTRTHKYPDLSNYDIEISPKVDCLSIEKNKIQLYGISSPTSSLKINNRILNKQEVLATIYLEPDREQIYKMCLIALSSILSIALFYKYVSFNILRSKSLKQLVETTRQKGELTAINAQLDGAEEERKRVANALHDGISSHLSAAAIQLQLLSNKNVGTSRDTTDKISELISQAANQSRNLSHELFPPILIREGLVEAVKRLAENYSTQLLEIVVEDSEALSNIPSEWDTKLYYILNELIQNVLKHSEASVCTIKFDLTDEMIRIIMIDNGIGIHNEIEGLGLQTIAARIKSMNGVFEYSNNEKGGLTSTISIPLSSIGSSIQI